MLTDKSQKRARRLRAILRFFSFMPMPVAHVIGAGIGFLLVFIPNKPRRISLINIALCYPDKSHSWHHKLMRRSMVETGKAFAEFGPLWFWKKERIEKLITEVYDEDVVDTALAEGNGMLIATPHMGSWELSSLYGCSRFPMTILYKPSRIPEIDPLILDARERFGAKMVPIDVSGIKAVVSALAKGETMGMLPDQEPKQGNGAFAPLFGVPAYTPTILSKLGSRKRVPVVFAMMERLPLGQGFSLHYMRASDDMYHSDPAVAARAINQCVEKCINIAPQQYMWNYKRFKTLPDGSTRDYKKKPPHESISEQCSAITRPIVQFFKHSISGSKRRRSQR